ncbi:hypothetical protein [Kitasatospora sp. GP82]|uniref:hypothetical protein n=1 Tax=Kitasatospora sp. GP82 TaxID=3035089 RepID=UPI002474F0CF|nr:hypothetical protein [Kitasatospora sp. GP82]
MHDHADTYEYADFDHPTRDEEKAAEIALDLADEQRAAEEERANPRPGHTERCEGCRGTGGGYQDEVWDEEEQDVVLLDYEHCPECGGCGYYDCDTTCDWAQTGDEY